MKKGDLQRAVIGSVIPESYYAGKDLPNGPNYTITTTKPTPTGGTTQQKSPIDKLKDAQDKSTAEEKAAHKWLADQNNQNDPGDTGADPGGNPGGNNGGNTTGTNNGGTYNKGGSIAPLLKYLQYIGKLPDNGTDAPVHPSTPMPSVDQRYQNAMAAANERLKQAYEYQQGQLSSQKDAALRESYIKQQMTQRGLPEQLSAMGINGGATLGVMARNLANYINQRSSIYGDYMNNLGVAGQAYQQGVMQNNADYLAQMAAYHQQLDMMRRQWELEQLENSGLLKKTNMGYNYGNMMGHRYIPMTAQDYLNNLRANYGNLFE